MRRVLPLRLVFSVGLALLAGLCFSAAREKPEQAAAPPEITLQNLASGLGPITSIASAGDDRLFLTLQTGKIVIYAGGQVRPAAFLDLTPSITCCGERGLLGLAFHPQFSSNRFFFVDYTNTAGNTVIARYQASSGNPDAADASSGVTLRTILQPFPNHKGGQLQFGPDGYLYIGMGDGGSANDPMCNGQRDDSLLGKLLRLDVNQNVSTPPYYGIPPSNPFAGAGAPLDEIWAKGLRNPWRFSFDRATGDLYIADVGQSAREEIDFQPRASAGGENYGWKIMEGTLCGAGGGSGCPPGVPPCNSPVFKPPIYEYGHVRSGDCTAAVIGGYVYRGAAYPQLTGIYFYGDYCFGWLFANGQMLTATLSQLTTFGQDSSGEIYLGTGDGQLVRLGAAAAPTPTPTSSRSRPVPYGRPRPTPRLITNPG